MTEELGRRFLDLLSRDEELFLNILEGDRLGIGLLSAIREVDLRHHALGGELSEEDREQFYLLRLALPTYVRETFRRVPEFAVPVITVARDPSNARRAQQLLFGLGIIEHGRRMAFASMSGMCSISSLEDRLFEFAFHGDFHDYEAHEASVTHYHVRHAQRRSQELLRRHVSPRTEEHIQRALRENVYVWRGRYIGYNADPAVDEYFFVRAYVALKLEPAFDSFPAALEFGGVAFETYLLCIAFLRSLAMKHEQFCEALVAKHPDILLGDILTVTASREEMIDNIESALNHFGPRFEGYRAIGRSEAELLYRVLSIRRDNAEVLSPSLMTLPYLVECSDSSVICCVSGPQLDSCNFLIEALKHNFPAEFDRHQRSREKSMQAALRRLLAREFPQLQFRENIHIRRGGAKLTDIDLVAIDKTTSTAMLFQLKHQDPYGADMKRRASRGRHLLEETGAWLEKMKSWLAETGAGGISATLQLKRSASIRRFHIVSVCRNFAHFLHPLGSEPEFAYATLIQFYDAIVRMQPQGEIKTLSGLFNILRRFMSHNLTRRAAIEPTRLDLPSLSFDVVQLDPPPNSACAE